MKLRNGVAIKKFNERKSLRRYIVQSRHGANIF